MYGVKLRWTVRGGTDTKMSCLQLELRYEVVVKREVETLEQNKIRDMF